MSPGSTLNEMISLSEAAGLISGLLQSIYEGTVASVSSPPEQSTSAIRGSLSSQLYHSPRVISSMRNSKRRASFNVSTRAVARPVGVMPSMYAPCKRE